MGFCLFNNVAVAAAAAIAELGLERVFMLDWDVHHGNGTAEIFDARGDVLFASIHQWPLYPGTGALEERGRGPGEGYTINLPVPPGSRRGRCGWPGRPGRASRSRWRSSPSWCCSRRASTPTSAIPSPTAA